MQSDAVHTIEQGGRAVADELREEAQAYAHGEDRPLGSYVLLLGVYGALVAALAAFVRATGRQLPERIAWSDLGMVTVATHKLARLLAKDPVTSPIRAPFTRYQGTGGDAEVAEEVRGGGLRHAVGELVSCPFCLGQWVATAAVFGLVVAPRLTRLVMSVFAILAGSDFLQFAYARLQES